MYPIIYAVFASFAFGAVAGVALIWATEAKRKEIPSPRTGIPAPTPVGSVSLGEEQVELLDELAARRRAA